jgi:hypothetical protein
MDVYKDWLGIPEGERPPDYYTLLRLRRFEDDADKVQAHYRKLNGVARKYATGQYMQESQDLLNELAKAMLCLTDPERKREYDEELGREFEDDEADGQKSTLKILLERGVITREQAREAEAFADARGLSYRDAAVQMKLTDADTATKAYAQELGRSYIDLGETTPDDSVLDRVPRNLVKRNQILPLFVDDDVVLVACAYEPTPALEDEIQLRFGMPMRGVLATPLAINQGIARFYAPGMRDEAIVETPAATKGGKGGKAAAAKPAKAAGPRKAASQLTEAEKKQRKQVGIIIICWAIIGSILLGMFVMPDSLVMKFLPAVLIAPITIWYVTAVYWK